MFNKIKGTQDFLDLTLFNFIIDQAKKHLHVYHFIEIATPILEPLELYMRSTGAETEIVSKQMFKIIANQKDEDICLRPEATPSTIRAFIENNIQQVPWKVFTWGPMFRYEKPQKGRFRQFHQFNMEIIGSNSISQDAQFIKMIDRFCHEILRLNNYALLLNFLGCFEDRKLFTISLDRFLEHVGNEICQECQIRREKNIMRIFDCKSSTCQKIYKDAPQMKENLCEICQGEFTQLQEQLELLSVTYAIQPALVRGLDYYSKTVFEFVSDNLGSQNSFCGGGRYNQLVSQLGGGADQPSVGAAFGIERLLLLLEPIKSTLLLPQNKPLHLILPIEKHQQNLALILADALQNQGLCVDILLEEDSIKSMMRKANKMKAKYCLILGPEEQEKKKVTIKNMITGESKQLLHIDVIKYLKS